MSVYDEPFLVSMLANLQIANLDRLEFELAMLRLYVRFAFDSRSMQVNLATMQITEQFQSQTSLQQ